MLEELIAELSRNPFDPELNFNVASQYHTANQIASAVTFYLRAAEYGKDTTPNIVYAALLRLAKCFEAQNDRAHTVSNCILQAIAYLPYRAEAYFWAARFYEGQQQWQECYTYAEIGIHQTFVDPLVDLEFTDYCLMFEKSVAAWWIGRLEEAKRLTEKLDKMDLAPNYRASVDNNLATFI
jgi:tetratricopeptide (TPR) repeat protein